ncbi:MAG: hypothetical protein M3511_07210 [Deinococcota bacterium]|jgi:hypothetical protein|nr:hypothetical protein [Deinococcota bacterium]
MRLSLDVEVMADRYEELEALFAELAGDDEQEPQEQSEEQELDWEWAA